MMLTNYIQTKFSNLPDLRGYNTPHAMLSVGFSTIAALGAYFYYSSQQLSPIILGYRFTEEKGSRIYKKIFATEICDQISDADWQSLPSRPDFRKFKIYFLLENCNAVIERIFKAPTEAMREVARNLGANPDLFHFNKSTEGYRHLRKGREEEDEHAFISISSRDGAISLSPNLLGSLLDWEDPTIAALLKIEDESENDLAHWSANLIFEYFAENRPRAETLGVLAHEIAHSVYEHSKKTHSLALHFLNVTTPADINDIVNINLNKQLPVTKVGAHFYVYFKKCGNWPDTINKIIMDHDPLFLVNKEKEADLFTVTVPEYGRGLRDYLLRRLKIESKRLIEKKRLKIEGDDFDEVSCFSSSDKTHPPLNERIDYLTKALSSVEHP